MRKREYISPTSIKTYMESPENFYIKYLADERSENEPQTKPMSVGSGFDAFCKSYLHQALFGKDNDPRFSVDAIFEEMVEPQNRDFAREAGQHVFSTYKRNGGLNDLLLELTTNSLDAPRMEFELKGTVKGQIGEATLLGKPDLSWTTKDGFSVIFDWKVNGYCSKSGVSPHPGYLRLRDEEESITNYSGTKHPKTIIGRLHGFDISSAHPMNIVNDEWAAQLSVYAWLLGMPIGSQFLTFIDQVACRPGDIRPRLRFAEHRTYVPEDFQQNIFDQAALVWDVCVNGHVFRDLSPEESKKKEELLDLRISKNNKDGDDTLRAMCKPSWQR
jgi:hypothetical protein